jgi:surface antigen
MKKLFIYPMVVVFLFTTIVGCNNRPNETGFAIGTGTLLGGATYLATKSKNKYTAPLTFIALVGGLMLGKKVGGAIDDVNFVKLNTAMNTIPDNKKVAWIDPNTQSQVEIEPTQTFQSEVPQFNTSSENWCRKVDWKISKNGESSFGETTVCRNELDGSWSPIFPLGEM